MKSLSILWCLFLAMSLFSCSEKPKNNTFTKVFDNTIQLTKEKAKEDSIANISLTDPLNIAAGKELFETNCVACHSNKGLETIGPNLCDKEWIYGNTAPEINQVITNGIPEKGMMAWKDRFTSLQIQQLVAYVLAMGEEN